MYFIKSTPRQSSCTLAFTMVFVQYMLMDMNLSFMRKEKYKGIKFKRTHFKQNAIMVEENLNIKIISLREEMNLYENCFVLSIQKTQM